MNDFDENLSKEGIDPSPASAEPEKEENTGSQSPTEVNATEEKGCFDGNDGAHSFPEAQRVVFNEDGTYRSVLNPSAENNKKAYEERSHAENSDNSHSDGSVADSDAVKDNTAGVNGQNQTHGQNQTQWQASNNMNGSNPPPPPPYGSYPYGYPPFNKKNDGYAYSRNGADNNANNMNNMYNMYNENMNPYAYYYGQQKKKKKTAQIFAIVAAVIFVLLMAVLVLILVGDKLLGDMDTLTDESTTIVGESQNVDEFVTQGSNETSDEVYEDGSLSPKSIYKKILPSSAGILVYNKSGGLSSEGSGVFFEESLDGKYTYLITCAHVIKESSGYIVVQDYNGKEYDAAVVGYDTRTDIGVLRVEATGFTLAEIGDSSKTYVGDPIYAIGNPGGVEFANSFTNGIVSALDRPVNSTSTGYTTDCIQHTAAINPGNSGGALVNSFGQVIGINSMKIVADEYEGMGFAVPSSVFQNIVNEIMANGYVTNRPKLGITYVPASKYSNYGMFVAIKGLPAGSIVIYSIASDSSLADTDVQAGDMIVGVNGEELTDASYLAELIEKSSVGDTLTLSIVRIHDDYSFEEFDVSVTLVEDRGNMTVEESASEDNGPSGSLEDYFREYFGE